MRKRRRRKVSTVLPAPSVEASPGAQLRSTDFTVLTFLIHSDSTSVIPPIMLDNIRMNLDILRKLTGDAFTGFTVIISTWYERGSQDYWCHNTKRWGQSAENGSCHTWRWKCRVSGRGSEAGYSKFLPVISCAKLQLKDSIPMGAYVKWKVSLVKNRFCNSGYAIMKTPPNFIF